MKRYWPWIAAVAALIAVLLAAVPSALRSHITSENFRRLLENRTSSALGAVAEISPLRWDGGTLFGESLKLHGTEGAGLHIIEARHVRARWDWMAVFSGAWRLEVITIESLKATFQPDVRVFTPSFKTSNADGNSSPSILPSRFEAGISQVRRADLEFGEVSLKDTSLEILNREGSWIVTGTGGRLSISNLPECAIYSFLIRLAGNSIALDSCTMRPDGGGNLHASGEWPGKLSLNAEDMDLPQLIGSPWDRMVSGRISGNATIDPNGASGFLSAKDASLRHVGWLRQLATLLNESALANPSFSRAEGSFRVTNNFWQWTGIVLESGGALRVEGDVSIAPDRSINGMLQLGLATRLVDSLPGAKASVFTTERDGYLWSPVVLGGSLDAPSEDLSPRIVTAAGAALIESVQPALQAVPERTRDAVGETLDTLFDLLGR